MGSARRPEADAPAKKNRLGRGLGALLGDYLDADIRTGGADRLPVASILPNPKQPRRTFPEAELDELARSIAENGLLQPLLVRSAPGGAPGEYELVAGERRLRAVKRLGWVDVPAITRQVEDDALLVFALVENLQREALNPIEEAEGYRALEAEHGLSHAAIARSVGKSRSTVANMLRLLNLPASVRKLVENTNLTTGHARALLGVSDPVQLAELARRAVQSGWSVREVERRVRRRGRRKKPGLRTRQRRDPVVDALEEELRAALATRVRVLARKDGKGVIEIPYRTAEDFGRVFELITGRDASEVVS